MYKRQVQKDDVTGARVESVMQFYDGLPVARMYNTVTNEGSENQTLEYISSFSYWGIEKEQKEGIPEFISSDDKMSMIVVHNGWQKELTVKKYRFADLGMAQTQPHNYQRTSKTIETVSYTHLDVYKRQVCKGRPADLHPILLPVLFLPVKWKPVGILLVHSPCSCSC